MAAKPVSGVPDAAVRARALDATRSFWVQAPAGSGKTELLIQRYLTLLARVAEPEAVVAITFTIKAAGEMRDRVLEALKMAAAAEPSETHKRTTWKLARAVLEQDAAQGWNLTQAPARLRIETFDALCLSLAKRLPVVARLGGQPEIEESPEYLYQRAAYRAVSLVEEDTEAGDAVRTLLHHLGNDLDDLSGWVAALLPRRDRWRLITGLERSQAREMLETNRAGLPELMPHYADREWELIDALLVLLPRAWGFLWEEFERAGRVDFSEVALAALRALGTPEHPTDLGLSIGHRIEHLLVDEMQDTSRTQLEIIRTIAAGWDIGDDTAPRTLFLVGDPMQSIYRFREADVSIALELEQGEAGLPVELETLRLTANFRSVPGVVNWVNGAFAKILSGEGGAAHGAVAYSPSEATRAQEEDEAVEFHGFLDGSAAIHTVDLAEAAVGRGEHTAILVRARTHLPEILAELARRPRILYHALDIDQLGERPAIGDLLALTRALLHPADRIAWLSVLRAPWCGLTLADLHALAAGVTKPLPERLGENFTEVSLDGQRRLARVVPILMGSLERARTVPLRTLVDDAWIALGGPACLATAADEADSQVFLSLLAQLDHGGAVSSFAELQARTDKLFARPDPSIAKPMLEIMTIHNAKGLEFDTVIVPGLDRPPKRDDPRLLQWTWLDGRLLVAPQTSDWDGEERSDVLERIRKIESAREKEEAKRLLYVAATRAKKHLYWMSDLPQPKHGKPTNPRADTFLAQMLPFFPASTCPPPVPSSAIPGQQIRLDLTSPPAIRRVPGTFIGGQLPPPPNESPIDVTYEWVGETLRIVGKCVHAWLQRMEDAAEMPSPQAIRSSLYHGGVTEDQLSFAAKRVQDSLARTRADERGRWILQGRPERRREFAITGVVEGEPVRSVIDCTFVESGIRWIIDFKTSFHEGSGIEEFLDNERIRYQAQLERYAALMRHLGPEPVKLGLYFPLLQGWREWAPEGDQRSKVV
jgi:ATP-dependent exoDNAse (exonuclease V) beta subunit